MKKIYTLLFITSFLVLPFFVSAQNPLDYDFDLETGATLNNTRPNLVGSNSVGSNSSVVNAPQLSGCRSIQNVDGLVSCALSTLKVVIYFLFSFAFIYTLYGAFRFIGAEGDSRDKWRDVIVYGIIGLFVMTSIWGLVGILDGTFGLSGVGPIKPPPIGGN